MYPLFCSCRGLFEGGEEIKLDHSSVGGGAAPGSSAMARRASLAGGGRQVPPSTEPPRRPGGASASPEPTDAKTTTGLNPLVPDVSDDSFPQGEGEEVVAYD